MTTDDWRTALARAFTRHDRVAALSVARSFVGDDATRVTALYDELAALLVDLGEEWRAGATEVWREHLASGLARTLVESCADVVARSAPPSPTATVILAAPSDEYHDLGLRMLADRFVLAGWRSCFLGANVPATEIVAAARSLDADAVALSASTHFHRLNLRAYVALLAAECPDVRVWVGGPAFAHEHDGWDDTMVLAPQAVPAAGSD